jgi:hypothetical protein
MWMGQLFSKIGFIKQIPLSVLEQWKFEEGPSVISGKTDMTR